MKLNRFLASLMLLAAGTAHADWSSVARHNNGEFFIDRSTIKIKGAQREVWSMMNYSNPQLSSNGLVYRSTKSLLQVECETRYARAIHMSFFTDLKLRGNEFGKMGSLPPWEKVPQDSAMREILDLVCKA
ncbi:MAG: hypothetical protein RL404_588 [Pseudomonadota bacterium]